jgi:reversibly glycosylated polypeptide/UDP-arabinopyranose mutase
MVSNIAVCIPTIRPDEMAKFMVAWEPLFNKHKVELVVVYDGQTPTVNGKHNARDILGDYDDCIINFNGGVRNLGFAYVARYLPEVEIIITLDDDEVPIGDPIQDHLDALNMRVPVSWMSTASEYMRGFPYGIRDEAEVVLSHGVWEGVADWDAPTQLVKGSIRPVEFYKGPIPKGIYFPMCIMNVGFKRKMLPYMYQAPWAEGVKRFDDIFAGITAKRGIDERGWAAVTGYSRVNHQRASNVFTNLQNEAKGILLNETYWKGDEDNEYFRIYDEKLATWQDFLIQFDDSVHYGSNDS